MATPAWPAPTTSTSTVPPDIVLRSAARRERTAGAASPSALSRDDRAGPRHVLCDVRRVAGVDDRAVAGDGGIATVGRGDEDAPEPADVGAHVLRDEPRELHGAGAAHGDVNRRGGAAASERAAARQGHLEALRLDAVDHDVAAAGERHG